MKLNIENNQVVGEASATISGLNKSYLLNNLSANNQKENEIWKVIPNYENYEASNFGRIRSIDRVVKRDRYTTRKIKGKILQQFAKNSGYLQVNLSKNSKIETKTVHRLVAITFLENTNNYTDVNHKDENKHNNNINNLEWCTRKYNMNYNKLPLKKYKKVLKFNKEGCLLCIYTSLKEAAELSNLSKSTISGYCNNLHKDPNGYIWKYETKK